MRQLFMQSMAGECGGGGDGGVGGGDDALRTPQSMQSVPYAHIEISELGLPSLLSLLSLSEENTLVSKHKKDAGEGEVAPRKACRLPRRDTLSPSKGVEAALSAHMPRETARSGKRSGKPPIAAGIAAVRMVVEGRVHVRTR
jgi:hypothetical protein